MMAPRQRTNRRTFRDARDLALSDGPGPPPPGRVRCDRHTVTPQTRGRAFLSFHWDTDVVWTLPFEWRRAPGPAQWTRQQDRAADPRRTMDDRSGRGE